MASALHMLQVREATVPDACAIVQLVESAYRGEVSRKGWTTEADLLGGQRTDEQAVVDLITTTGSYVLLGFQATALVSCVHLKQTGNSLELGLFAVAPELQARGIGKRLLGIAETRARETYQARTLRMRVIAQRLVLIEFYQRRGYRMTGERAAFPYGDARYGLPLREDLEFVVLEKQL